ncbi:MAG: S8 family peptidase [Planctomycetota bacterium]|jgi:subtilisin family serine protease
MIRDGYKCFTIRGICLIAMILLFSTAGQSETKTRPLFVPGEVIVKFKEDAQIGSLYRMRDKLGVKIKRRFRIVGAYHLYQLRTIAVKKAVEILKSDPNVEYASPNYYRYIDVIPSDPGFSDMWGLNNTGQTGGTIDADIDAPEAWEISKGDGNTVIAVIDSGAQLDHEDLANNIWVNPGEDLNGNGIVDPFEENGIDDDLNGFVDDFHGWNFAKNNNDPSPTGNACVGHGTHTAGTIAAVGNNGIGVTGVNWNAKLMILNAFRQFLGIFCLATDADLIEAIEYATLMGVKVSSNSWGGGPANPAMEDAIRKSNMLFVAAAGNGGFDGIGDNTDVIPHYPSSYGLDNIVSVAATDHNDLKASFSNFGITSVDLGAPGSNILSTLPSNSYGSFSGTSMATPHVAGVAGLLLAQDPSYTVRELKWRILTGAESVPDLAGKALTNGRLNAFNSLTLPQASETGVTVELSPAGPTSVPRGGSFDLNLLVKNNVEEPVFIVAIVYIKLPSGHDFPLVGPFVDVIVGGTVISEEVSLPISTDLAEGVYRLFILILNPDNLEEDVVEFEVTP